MNSRPTEDSFVNHRPAHSEAASAGEYTGVDNALDVPGIDGAIGDLQDSSRSNPVGFQAELPGLAAQIDAASQAAHLAPPPASPPPKRPKGRLIIGVFLLGLLVAGFYIVWDGVFRYGSYGVVEANRMPIRADKPGFIQRVYAAEGQRVTAGDLLVVLDSTDLRRQLAQTQDALSLSEARLDALMTSLHRDLKRAIQARGADAEDFNAEYFELASRLRAHRVELERLGRSLERALDLKEKHVLTQDQYDTIYYAQLGEKKLVEMLEKAVEHLKRRTTIVSPATEVPIELLRPALVEIDNHKHELLRLREDISHRQILSPVSGIVVKRESLTGRWVETSELLMEIVEEGSTQPVIYFSQNDSRPLEEGQEIHIHVLPHHKPLECVVERIGSEYRPVPLSIERYYSKNEHVLPVFLRSKHPIHLAPGATIHVPHSMSELHPSFAKTARSKSETGESEESSFELSSKNFGRFQ